MFNTILLGAALLQGGPYNYTGKLTDFLPEGAAWGMPSSGLPVQITITESGATQVSTEIKGPKWKQGANLKLTGLKFANGTLTGQAEFKNTTGSALAGVRFDVVSATETYKEKDETKTRTQAIAEESPLLLGDMPQDASFEATAFKATGFLWKPETTSITVTAKLSGLSHQRDLFPEHAFSTLDFDAKGRLLIGSGTKPGIYRANLETGAVELVSPTPEYKVAVATNPVDGTICATWSNGHLYTFYSPGGDEKKSVQENGEVEGMTSWPSMPRYDGKGNVYLGFGNAVSQFQGEKPVFVLKSCGQFEFGGYIQYDVAKDGTLFIGSLKNIFKFDPGGKNGRLFLKGPNGQLGRIHDISTLRLDPNGNLWVSEPSYDEFTTRVSVFDSNGKLVWVLGRGGPSALQEGFYEGQIPSNTSSFAFAGDGRVYVATEEQSKSVMEFVVF